MQFSVTFRHMEATEALKTYAKERMGRIKKYFPDPIAVHVVMSTERGYNHRVDVTLQLHNGMTVAGHEATENMYSSIDQVTAKIEKQVRRYKEKLRAHNHRGRPLNEPITWSHSVVEDKVEAAIEEAAAPTNGASARATTESEPVVVKSEQFHANPMSVTQAIAELKAEAKEFLVFRSEETGAVNVVYKRGDGSYGLIETPAPS